jgi:hypothetical protein
VTQFNCTRCDDGYHEDGPCYHCSTTGYIDEETHFQDQLSACGHILAAYEVDRIRTLADSDPDGEGFAFRAAEDMMTVYEYTTMLHWDISARYHQMINEMTRQDQEILVALSLIPNTPPPEPKREIPETLPAPPHLYDAATEGEEIPF